MPRIWLYSIFWQGQDNLVAIDRQMLKSENTHFNVRILHLEYRICAYSISASALKLMLCCLDTLLKESVDWKN